MKKLISIIISACIMFSMAFAINTEEAGNVLFKMKLMSGYPDGTLGLENNITRAEFCCLVAKMLGIESQENFSVDNFSDLANTHWAYKSVMALADRGFINGYEDFTFRPSNTLTYAECCAILVNVLGYNSKLEGVWPTNVITMAENLSLDTDLEVQATDKMTRGLVSIMLINSMDVKLEN